LRPEVTLARLRRFLLALSAVLLAGAVTELWLVEHTEDPVQLTPFVLCGLGAAVAVVALLRPNRASLWALRAVMLLVAAGSLLGVYLHVEGNFALESELNPGMAGAQLLLGALGGANPLLAPGVLAVAAVLALAATYQHPAIAGGVAQSDAD
jgi:peptidoglycan/LPS O-acetylase OafA/YrhL